MSTPSKLSVSYQPIHSLKSWPGNPKGHDLESLIRSIQEFGFTVPIAVDSRTGQIVAGHGRVAALREIQKRGDEPPTNIPVGGRGKEPAWLVPTISLDLGAPQHAKAYLLADNRLTELGGWDQTALAQMIAEVANSDALLIGWSPVEVSALLKAAEKDSEQTQKLLDQEAKTQNEDAQEDRPSDKIDLPHRSILVHFKDEHALEDFWTRLGFELGPKHRAFWFPPNLSEVDLSETESADGADDDWDA